MNEEILLGLFKEIREELQETAAASRPSRYAWQLTKPGNLEHTVDFLAVCQVLS